MRILITIALLILLPLLTDAQPGDPYLDSLQKSLVGADNDSLRMELYSDLGSYYLLSNHDSSLFYLQQALPIAVRLGLKLNEASILNTTGLILMYREKFSESFGSFLKAINIAKYPRSKEVVWHLPTGQTSDDARLSVLSYSYDFIGLLNAFAGNWTDNIKSQLKNFREAEKLAIAAGDKEMIPLATLHIGIAYMNAGNLDSALNLQNKALSMFTETKNLWGIGVTKKYLGDTYTKKGLLDSARDITLQAIMILKQANDYGHGGRAYLSLSRAYIGLRRPDSALYYARESLNIFQQLKDPVGKKEAYNLLVSYFDRLNMGDSATVYLRLSKSLTDSLGEEERKNLLAFQEEVLAEQIRVEKLEKEKIDARNRMRTYALVSGIAIFLGVILFLYRNNKARKKTNEILRERNEKIENTLNQLRLTQAQLIQSEKMASLGELTAGIAHEIQNPLNFVNNFSEINGELIKELKKEAGTGNIEEVTAIAKDIEANSEKINHHGKRADAIVKGMLQHSRTSSGQKEPTDINRLADEYLRLSYQGFRAKDKSFNATIITEFGEKIGTIHIIPQEIGRVFLNLINNSFYSVSEKQKQSVSVYKPTVTVSTAKLNDKIEIKVKDNGNGIPDAIKEKIFQPFFTTKPAGQGTGLGLSLAYDIVKAHGGEIKVETKENEGSEFIIQLPS